MCWKKNLPCVRSPWLGQKDVMGVRSNSIAQIMVRKWISPPLSLQNAEKVWWKCTNTCKVGFFFILVTFLAHDTSEILPSSISFFFPFFFTKSKEVWNICGDKCQHSDCKLHYTLLYRKYCRYFFAVTTNQICNCKPIFVKFLNILQHTLQQPLLQKSQIQ